MSKRIFLNFPFLADEPLVLNPELITLFADNGGLPSLLDPQKNIPESFRSELEFHGFDIEELKLLRRLLNSSGRERVLLSLACLGRLASLSEDQHIKKMYEGYFFKIKNESNNFDISYEELSKTASELSPYW